MRQLNRAIKINIAEMKMETFEGESIEAKLERIITSGEGIEATSPIIYTEKKEGVKAEYNIRTDRFDIALDAIDKVQKYEIAKNMNAEIIIETKDNKTGSDEVNTSD